MNAKELKKCETCAWIKLLNNSDLCPCTLKGVEVWKGSVGCDDWSEVGLL